MLVEILIGIALVLAYIYFKITKDFNYWKKKGVPYVSPSFPFGSGSDMFFGKADAGTVLQRWYTQYKKQGLKYFGTLLFQQPTLNVIDLDLVKHILTKDFHHFVSREFSPTTHEYISRNLFALEGQEWKDMRTKLSPTFTSGKIKNMFTLMGKCADQLQNHIENVTLKEEEFQVKNLIARFTIDIIATCAFGLEVNSIEDKENEFYKIGQLLFVPKRSLFLKFAMHMNFPRIARLLKLNFFDPKVTIFLTKVIKDTVEYRKEHNITRNDFVDLLLKVKEHKLLDDDHEEKDFNHLKQGSESTKPVHDQKTNHDRLTLEEMVAQSFVFFAAGFETAASTTSFCLYELAMNPNVQDRLRAEIDEVLARYEGETTYQAIHDMVYMDQVLNETLRRYASLAFLTRVCTETYQIPNTDLVVGKGVRVVIPTYAIHHDPDIYPDPFKFDPDRFSEENHRGRHHYAFLPFGEGPRICIGMRFGRLQVKMGLVAILSKYQLSPAPSTPAKLEIHPLISFTTPKHPFALKISKRLDV